MRLPCEYYSGQGRVSFAERNQLGRPDAGFTFLGDCSKLETKATVERKEHSEHQTGKGGVDNVFETAQKVELQATFDEIVEAALNLYIYGNTEKIAAATVTAEPAKLYLGKEVPTQYIPDTFASLTDVGGTTTYVLGTDYLIGETGMIAVPTTGSAITDGQDVELNYLSKDERISTAFTANNRNLYLRFDGLNRASDNKEVIIEIYKARFNPSEMLAMINDDHATYDLNGMALFDKCHADNSLYGGYMRIRLA